MCHLTAATAQTTTPAAPPSQPQPCFDPEMIHALIKQLGSRKRPRKQVRFDVVDNDADAAVAAVVDVESSSSSSSSSSTQQPNMNKKKIITTEGFLSNDEVEATWYQPNEIAKFKLEAKCHIIGHESTIGKEYRGFERYTLERAQHKLLAIRCTLLAYQKGYTEENIKHISKKGSSWFQKCAFVQACHDYCDVHQPHMKHLLPDTPQNDNPFGSLLKDTTSDSSNNKRCNDSFIMSSEEEGERSVRRRIH